MSASDQDSLVDLIHDTPFNPALWVGVMEQLGDMIGGQTACLTELDIVTGAGRGISAHVDPTVMDEYLAHWTTRNPLQLVEDPLAYVRDFKLKILRDGEWMDRDALRASPYFNEFLAPLGAEHSIFIRLGLSGTAITAINIARSDAEGAFQERELATVRHYQGHLAQAVRTARRVRVDQDTLDDLDALLGWTPQPLFFIGGGGLVRRMAAAAERFLSDDGGLTVVEGALHATCPKADAALQKLLRGSAGGSVTIASTRSARCFTVTVSPLGPRSLAVFSGDRFTMVSVAETAAMPTRELDVRAAYGLTAAEGRVALAIGEGLSIRQVSERLGVSTHTVRAQLGAVFAKTDCRRQADLVRLLLQRGMTAH